MDEAIEWERLKDIGAGNENTVCRSARLKVPGGWIVRTTMTRYEAVAVTQTFVVDPDYTWEFFEKKD